MNEIKEITLKSLKEDIYWTEQECIAYEKLSDGYFILSNMPEIDNFTARQYAFKAQKYHSILIECRKFLKRLNDLKENKEIS